VKRDVKRRGHPVNKIMKLLQFIKIAAVLCASNVSASENAEPPAFDSTSVYQQAVVEGFTVLINPEVVAHEEQARLMRAELERQLKEITRVVPDKVVVDFRKYRIWVEWELTQGGACFHPSREWLSQNGYNTDKAGDIEICHTRHFINWSKSAQPCLVLHEMAHAYHHILLGLKDERVSKAFQSAVDQKLYERVKHVNGSEQKAYALTNKKEYFSELTESYFGKNDFYPFIRSELQEYDPVGYQMMVECWGIPKE
jgi:hypothetical protein